MAVAGRCGRWVAAARRSGRRVAGVAVAAVLVAGCGGEDAATPLAEGGGAPAPTSEPGSAATGQAQGTPAGETQLTSGSVRLTVRPQDAAQRPVLDAYLGFFAAYADALQRADARAAQLRRRSTPDAFADFARGLAANAREGVTLRGPVALQPVLRPRGSGALTVIVDDCLDGSGQRYYDRAGKPTGEAGARRPIRVELVDSPGPVRWVVRSLADGPASTCERPAS